MIMHEKPQSLEVTVVHDGRLLFELLGPRGLTLEIGESDVDDVGRTIDLLVAWAAAPAREARPRWQARADRSPDYRDGVTVAVSSELSTRPTGWNTAGLRSSFDRAFGAGAAPASDARPFAEQLASALARFLRRSRETARVRLAGGAYVPVMRAALERLRGIVSVDDQMWHDTFEGQAFAEIVSQERYLALSEDAPARELHLEVARQLSSLYNWYMDLAKGGSAHPRH